MDELKTTTAIVKQVLEAVPVTRNCDGLLYLRVLSELSRKRDVDYLGMKVSYFFSNLEQLKVPSIETVGRFRRKVQEECPHLRAVSEVEKFRADREAMFREYARN